MTDPNPLDAAAEQLGDLAQRMVPIAEHSTYKVGGPAALYVEATQASDLTAVGRAVRTSGVPVLVVGNGSNLLVADAGFPGLALHLAGTFEDVHVDGTRVVAGGAALLPVVARQSVRAGLTGFEWAVGVPGSIGGGVRMNAGGHGSDMSASLVEVHVFDCRTGEDEDVPAAALDLGYRHSAITADQVVTAATLQLAPDEAGRGSDTISEIVRWRRANQPGGQNAGSVFTNPEGDSAGRLIEAAGCKGLRRGTAAVSDKHANFIQADAGGSADDVFAVMVAVRDAVEEATGIRLHPETRLIGFDGEVFR